MSNPNNCATCDHKRNPQGGWCYAFRDEPNDVCMQHTGRKKSTSDILAYFGVKQDGNDSPCVQAAD